MALRIPVEFEVEYRGQAKAGEFVRQETGEKIEYGPKLKFEYEDADGDVTVVPVSSGQLDRCEPPIDYTKFKKGEAFVLVGHAVLQDRGAKNSDGSAKDSYLGVSSLRPVGAVVQKMTAAG